MNKDTLLSLKEEIVKNYAADIAAINQLIDRQSPERLETQSKLATAIEAASPKKSTYQIAEELIKISTEPFNVASIYLKLREIKGKYTSHESSRIISQVINKLKHRNPPEILEVAKGTGSRSGTYKYIKP
jgi:hypothetical protein